MQLNSDRFVVPLMLETRAVIDTETAAFHLNRKSQTLRAWASRGAGGPVLPLRVGGRLAWPVAEIKKAVGL